MNPLVVIRCITYNHESYIRDALEGFVMQKTNFPFVAIVHDDASTDGTTAVIREYAEKYPDIIKPIYETENQYSKRNGSVTRIVNNACDQMGAKYLAYCEGDDYWTDPLKLQKQVDFLEAHHDYTMSYTDAIRLYQDSDKRINLNCQGIESFNQLLLGNTITTATVVIRKDILDAFYVSKIHSDLGRQRMSDYQMWLWAATKGRIHHVKDATTVYRILQSSASHGNFSFWLKFLLSASTIKFRFAKEMLMDSTDINAEKLLFELVLAYDQSENDRLDEVRGEMLKLSSFKLSRSNRIKYSIAIRFPRIAYSIMKLRYKQEVAPSTTYVMVQRLIRKIMKIK